MLIVNNPSVNAIDIVDGGRRLSIKPKQDGQELRIDGEQAKALQARLSKSHPYLSFGKKDADTKASEAKAKAEAEAKAKAEAEAKAAAEAGANEDAKGDEKANAESAPQNTGKQRGR